MFDLQNAILTLDPFALSVDQVYDLNELCPTNEEMEMITVQSAHFFPVLVVFFPLYPYITKMENYADPYVYNILETQLYTFYTLHLLSSLSI